MQTKTTAPAVSAVLRRLGFQPMGSASRTTREGLRVTESGNRVRVVADLNSDREAHDLAIAARQALIGAGYKVEVSDEAAFYVAR